MELVKDTGTNQEDKRWFTRSEAQKIIDGMLDPDFMNEEDWVSTANMTNEDLENELCLSGYIHDEYMGGVKDD